jgi:hypothetical protein
MTRDQEIRKFLGEVVYYDECGGGFVWAGSADGEQLIADLALDDQTNEPELSIRGWGAIQNLFNNPKDAANFQDSLGEWIADAINTKLKSK